MKWPAYSTELMPVKSKAKIKASREKVRGYKGISFDEIIQRALDRDDIPDSLLKAVTKPNKNKDLDMRIPI